MSHTYLREIHYEVQRNIAISDENYKAQVDVWRHFAKSAYKKLYSKNVGSSKIVKKTSFNAYLFELPYNMGTTNVFDIIVLSHLTLYIGDYTVSHGEEATI